MALDINKIIRESINEVVTENTEVNEDEIQTITENTDQVADTGAAETATDDVAGDANKMCVASAISAGLGAMTLRNRLRGLSAS